MEAGRGGSCSMCEVVGPGSCQMGETGPGGDIRAGSG